MKSILDTCTPRADILTGAFNPEIFTASLSQVMDHYRGKGTSLHTLYTDAESFFRKATYPTHGMKAVVSEVMARLTGDVTVPAIHRLETAFGGGKTHTLIALVHLAYGGRGLGEIAQSLFEPGIFTPDRLPEPGAVAVVGVAGDEIPVHKPKWATLVPYTLWGELAFQIGGETLYREVESDAESYAAPDKRYFERIFAGHRVLILLDELAQYATRLNAARPDGAAQLAAFLMSLLGYARNHAGIAVVVTLAGRADAFAGQTERLARLLAGIRGEAVSTEEAGRMAETARSNVGSVIARDATVTVPVQANEISQVLAKRLFDWIDPVAAAETAAAYMAMYAKSAATLPEQATREDFRQTLEDRYPFHPTLIDYLNNKLATLENFQGTRGVLRVLALTVRNLWQHRGNIPMIHTAHLDLQDARIVNEIFGRSGANDLLPALNADIGSVDTGGVMGGVSRAQLADRNNPHPAGYPLHEYAWKVAFLHSLVGRSEGLGSNLFGITPREALFETAFPGMTPPQVETALKEIDNSAFYLRYSSDHGRYYASLDASVNRVLAEIRAGLSEEQAREQLAAVARSAVKSDEVFRVVHDVSLPEHIPDKTDRPVLAVISLEADEIELEALVTTAGPNRPRIQQNLVFLLAPHTVHVQGEVWREERVSHTEDIWRRRLEEARDVIARRKLKEKPENYGIRSIQLAAEQFDQKTRERELALQTNVTQLFDSLWFPGSSGQLVRKELHAGVGQILSQVNELLDREGELVTAARVGTQEALLSLGKLLFQVGETPTLEKLREQFKVNRRWPVLQHEGVFDTLIREGISRGHWCLFRFVSAESIKPELFLGRDEPLPFDLDLRQPGLSLITLQGAKQRGWVGKEPPPPDKVATWVRDAMAEQPAAYVAGIIDKVTELHGDVPEQAILEAVDQLVREDRLAAFNGAPEQMDTPEGLQHGPGALLHKVNPQDVIITPAEASKRGWIEAKTRAFELKGKAAAEQLVPLLNRLGGIYGRGAKSRIAQLELMGLEIEGGGQLRIGLQNVPPAGMKRLGELFEVLHTVVKLGAQSQGLLRIEEPDETCPLLKELKQD